MNLKNTLIKHTEIKQKAHSLRLLPSCLCFLMEVIPEIKISRRDLIYEM